MARRERASDSRDLLVEFDAVDAAKMPYLSDLLGIPVAGSVTGKIDLKLPQQKLSLAEGTIDLQITDFELGDGKAKIRDTIALPKVKAGQFIFKADVTEGTVKITELSTKGTDLEVVSDGRIRLLDRAETSMAELNLRFKFADAYKNKDDMTRSIFGAPGSAVPGLFDLDPKMKRAKRDDGFYAWRITGPLQRLQLPSRRRQADRRRRHASPPIAASRVRRKRRSPTQRRLKRRPRNRNLRVVGFGPPDRRSGATEGRRGAPRAPRVQLGGQMSTPICRGVRVAGSTVR